MKTKLRNRVLRNLRPAIEVVERLYDSVRDNPADCDDRQDALDQLGIAIAQMEMARARLRDDLHEWAPADMEEAGFPP